MQKECGCGLCRTAQIIYDRRRIKEFKCQSCGKEWEKIKDKWASKAQEETKMAQK
ncbi:MAG: hypothetical protein AAB906_04590 [Patescibacteria group bacterium]